jgi:anti-sigma-K factor RskA
MSCEVHRQFELGEIEEAGFNRHAQSCAECQRLLEQDTQLLALAKSLQQPAANPLLWAKIENALHAEQQRRRLSWLMSWEEQKWAILRVAAVLLLALGAGSYFLLQPKPSPSRLLAGAALEQVEKKEHEYADAIAELERVALPQMAKMDVDLMLLYRDRLETIDAQIARCQEALAANPANAHIRRYLLAALQDKKETLKELADFGG